MTRKLALFVVLVALVLSIAGSAHAVPTCSCSTCWLPHSQWPATCLDTFNFNPPRERTQIAYCSSCR